MQSAYWNIKRLKCFGFSVMRKSLIKMKRSTKEMINGYLEFLRTF